MRVGLCSSDYRPPQVLEGEKEGQSPQPSCPLALFDGIPMPRPMGGGGRYISRPFLVKIFNCLQVMSETESGLL